MPKATSALADITPTKIPTGRRSKRPPNSQEDGPVDYAFRDPLPAEREGQITREGKPKATLDDPRLERLTWYILRTAPREEMRATLLLERKGHAVLYPRENVFRRKTRYYKTKVGVLRPLTRGYLFVGFVHNPNWLDVLSCQSLLGVVSVDGKPRVLPFDRAASFMKGHAFRSAPDRHKHMISNREYDEGDVVEVLAGPMGGVHVKVQTIHGRFAQALLAYTSAPVQPIRIPLDNLVALT